MTSRSPAAVPVRDRLLLAGARLLEEADGGDVSTRAICEAAGVQAPTLYHHFGSKQGLLDDVVSHGFRRFLAARPPLGAEDTSDPLDAIRDAWDIHVQFGVEHPRFYGYIYAPIGRETPCRVVSEVEEMILSTLEPAALHGRLTVAPADAARQILAASSGVVLSLIANAGEPVDGELSRRTRDAILASITRSSGTRESVPTVSSTAIALQAALDAQGSPLGAPETALLHAWLRELAATAPDIALGAAAL
ncbi:TetR/AcrR family transcriptional regulator [Microbacterium ulmi]|uniref:TetR/AcrR family transcriptional regulator n=1 Tax=Microbacterium ulmi TaxID=179095 RepID=A0A7Y2Q1H5_9MICO|nr:TetR/AcrR family transcriptional regulator [Microbacterium ulmi]NII68957.1 AcrR family transcriptional regulator [Microbacterium ulmi]NNH03940.1 TetR/AcrR family transcriptional regulator [Microbacterium ulmi]